jgi:hypothetical protein
MAKTNTRVSKVFLARLTDEADKNLYTKLATAENSEQIIVALDEYATNGATA